MLIYHFSEIDCIESAVDVYPCLAHGFLAIKATLLQQQLVRHVLEIPQQFNIG